jgi:hypothetical protein
MIQREAYAFYDQEGKSFASKAAGYEMVGGGCN